MARIEDGWKEELLAKQHITAFEMMQMDTMRREWIKKYPHVFALQVVSDSYVNLLHRDNFDIARRYRATAKENGWYLC